MEIANRWNDNEIGTLVRACQNRVTALTEADEYTDEADEYTDVGDLDLQSINRLNSIK